MGLLDPKNTYFADIRGRIRCDEAAIHGRIGGDDLLLSRRGEKVGPHRPTHKGRRT